MSTYVAKTLDDAIKLLEPTDHPPFRLVTVRGARPRRGVDLARPRELDAVEDQNQFGNRHA